VNINCWEFCECGRQPGGDKVDLLGPCPTPLNEKYDGINNGKNAGRYCWKAAGTMSDAKPDCIKAEKIGDCLECDFFQLVKAQQQENFTE
jgi:hypothetical protein